MIRRAFCYIFRLKLRERLPRLPRMYATEYDRGAVSRAEEQLMRLSAARDPASASILARRQRMSVDELARSLPIPRPRRRARILPALRRLAGTTAYDPVKRF